MCNCYAGGLTTPPPHQEHVCAQEGYLELDLPWETHQAEHCAFDEWMAVACAHEGMNAACEHIANWTGYRLFREALGLAGWERFPTLRAVLPDANGGLVPAAESARCLEELQAFEGYRTSVPALFDSETGAVLRFHVQLYQGAFYSGRSGMAAGIDGRGLFVLERQEAETTEIFRALRIEQRPVVCGGEKGAELVDLDSGARLTVALRIGEAIPWPDGRNRGRSRALVLLRAGPDARRAA